MAASEEELYILDKHLGEMIESIVYKYGYNVDVESEYEELLEFIHRRLVKAWFRGRKPSPEELEAALKNAKRRKRRHLEVLLSFLISRYAARNGPVYVQQHSDWRDDYY